jgi:hypothetical protein
VLVTGGKKIIGYVHNGPPVLVTGGKKIIGYARNGPPVLVTGGKKIIGYVRLPLHFRRPSPNASNKPELRRGRHSRSATAPT